VGYTSNIDMYIILLFIFFNIYYRLILILVLFSQWPWFATIKKIKKKNLFTQTFIFFRSEEMWNYRNTDKLWRRRTVGICYHLSVFRIHHDTLQISIYFIVDILIVSDKSQGMLRKLSPLPEKKFHIFYPTEIRLINASS
jgi:hypothetical protein